MYSLYRFRFANYAHLEKEDLGFRDLMSAFLPSRRFHLECFILVDTIAAFRHDLSSGNRCYDNLLIALVQLIFVERNKA